MDYTKPCPEQKELMKSLGFIQVVDAHAGYCHWNHIHGAAIELAPDDQPIAADTVKAALTKAFVAGQKDQHNASAHTLKGLLQIRA